MPSSVVVDASAVGAIIFREPEARLIGKQLDVEKWFAPELVDYEMGSILKKKITKYPEIEANLWAAMDLYNSIKIHRVSIPPKLIVELALIKKISVYDASYLWLSRNLGIQLVTLDKKLKKSADC